MILPLLLMLVFGLMWTTVAAYERIEVQFRAASGSERASDEQAYRALYEADMIDAGTVSYRRGLVRGYAASANSRMHWRVPLIPSAYLSALSSSETTISDPDGWLRTLQLIQDAARSINQRIGSKQAADRRVDQVLGNEAPVSFASHRIAASYLRSETGGIKARYSTPAGDRIIDALDGGKIAHQAFLTFRESQLRHQLRKDRLLLQDGMHVLGVVWHFYRRTGQTGRVGPSQAFVREAKEAGVVIQIHG